MLVPTVILLRKTDNQKTKLQYNRKNRNLQRKSLFFSEKGVELRNTEPTDAVRRGEGLYADPFSGSDDPGLCDPGKQEIRQG